MIEEYKTIIKIFPVFLTTLILGCLFCFVSTCAAGSVTVGHTNSGANYICDGVDDGYEINQALATKQTVKLITDSPYNMGSTSITVPGNDVTYTLTANTPSNPPTIKATQNYVMINAPNAKFDISYLKFDGNGHQASCIDFSQAWAGSRIDNCFFGGYTSTSSWTATGIHGTAQNSILVDHNQFIGGNGVSIWIEGKTDPNNRGAYAQVSYNQLFFNSNGDYTKQNMAAIEGNHLHIDHNNIVSEGGEGISVSRSWVEYNVVRGCSEIGIKPSGYPVYDSVHPPQNDYFTYFTDYANNCYDLIDHNIVEYNGANGIDYWYSDGSVITNNRCNDNGQDADPHSLWDRDGIDVNDHSQNTTISNNEATNKASTISDTVTAVGSNYVAVAHLNFWYDYRNGGIVPFNGLNVHIGSTNNKISSVDVGASKIYLVNAPTGVAVGNAIAGVNEQTIGINVASNGQSLGGHNGAHNNVYGNLNADIVPTINGSILPNTNITADGIGPVPPFDDGDTCVSSCSGKTCGDNGCGGSCGTCASGQTCSNGTCAANTKLANGQQCSSNSECSSGVCSCGYCVPGSTWCGGMQSPLYWASGSYSTNQWLSGYCNNGVWQTAANGYGCSLTPGSTCGYPQFNCVSGYTCDAAQNNGQGGNGKCVASACSPKTCATLGNYNCGSWSDTCGATINCGTCALNQACSNGTCISNCKSHASKKCDGNDLYWYNTCNAKEELAQDCGTDTVTSIYQCNGNWLQLDTVKKGCTNGACYSSDSWTNDTDCSISNKICQVNACLAANTNPPAINAAAPAVNITANGSQGSATVGAGDPVTLSWNSTSADTCRASGDWSGNLATSGTQITASATSKNYTVTCTNSSGSSSASVKVSIQTNTNTVTQKPATQMTRAELLAAIARIQALIADLQKQLAALTGSPTQNASANQSTTFSCTSITKNLFYGMKNDPQVKCLQEILKAQGLFGGTVTGNFGAITKAAVIQFQQKYASDILAPYGLKSGTGSVGSSTRAKLNQIIVE